MTVEDLACAVLDACEARFMKFNEDSRFKIPAILHLSRLGYTYWVIQVPDDIMREHGGDPKTDGIFNARMTQLIGALAKVSKASEVGRPPTLSLAPIERTNPSKVP